MANFAIIQTGGKQYIVKPDQEILVERLSEGKDGNIEFKALAMFDGEGTSFQIGAPALDTLIKAKILEEVKGDKVRVSKFKAKVRRRKVTGFRPKLTKVKILNWGKEETKKVETKAQKMEVEAKKVEEKPKRATRATKKETV